MFSRRMALVIGFLCGLGRLEPARAQLTVVSTFPVDGAVLVDTTVTFEFVFSEPIDTTAQYEITDGFFLGVFLYPKDRFGEPEEIRLSEDQRTVWIIHCRLHPDTRYVVGILGAKSVGGGILEKPTVITFSTGPSLPGGRVGGTISGASGYPGKTVIGLFTQLFSDEPPAALGVTDAEGRYVISYVPAGTYWPGAILDVNASGDFDPEPGIDRVGLYDPDADGFADSLTVAEGESRMNVDMTLASMERSRARDRYPQIQAKALAWAADAVPVLIGSGENVDLAGRAFYWVYLFHSQNRSTYFSVIGTTAFLGPFAKWEEEPPLTTPIPPNWADSDAAVDSAEAHGGAAFRAAHPDAQIQAFLGVFSFGSDEEAPSQKTMAPDLDTRAAWTQRKGMLQKSRRISRGPSRIAQENPVWTVMYTVEEGEDFLIVFLDPVTAEFISSFPPPPTSARENLETAGEAAKAWASDAELLLVVGGGLNVPEGLAMIWSFIYRSASRDAAWGVMAGGGMVLKQEPFIHTFPSDEPLPQDWVDSPQVIALCEARGGALYRSANQDVQVDAYLSKGLYGERPALPVWWVQYMSSTSPTQEFFVDAVTGSLVTDVERRDVSEAVPRTHALGQNYPNPFNPETSIPYVVKEAGRVVLTVYDPQGRLMATLVDRFQAPGVYRVTVDGRSWPPGLYVYRIAGNGFEAAKKMVLMR